MEPARREIKHFRPGRERALRPRVDLAPGAPGPADFPWAALALDWPPAAVPGLPRRRDLRRLRVTCRRSRVSPRRPAPRRPAAGCGTALPRRVVRATGPATAPVGPA